MLDIPATLRPPGGVATHYAVRRPEPPDELLWCTAIKVDTGQDAVDLPPSMVTVGAYGHTRGDSLVRGAGEAVERYALYPGPRGDAPRQPRPVRASAEELDEASLDYSASGAALGAPDSVSHRIDWYPARRLRDDMRVLVPSALVDWPVSAEQAAHFDSGPSCAAAGEGFDHALRSALFEMIERDAVMVAWERGLGLPRIDVAEEASRPDAPAQLRAASALVSQASHTGVEVHVACIPTGVPGVFCAVGVAVDSGGDVPVAAVGGRAADDPSEGVLGAVREALQVCSFLRNVARVHGRPDRPPARIRGEEDRTAFLVTRTGSELVLDWLRGFSGDERLPAATPVPTGDLVTGLVADGADPLVVDLTPRLPPSLVDMGWAVARVVPAGYQHLRMSEEFSWSWNLPRIAGAEARTGLPARFRPGEGRRPNPLP